MLPGCGFFCLGSNNKNIAGSKQRRQVRCSFNCILHLEDMQPFFRSVEKMEIIDRIYDLIKTRNTNANRVTKGCGLNSNIFTFWKSGRQKPSLDALIKIANYFNVSLDYLVGREILNKQDISNNATISPVFNRFCKLTEIQQAKVMAYMDGLESLENTFNTRQIISNIVNDTPSVKKENHKEVIDQ